MDDEINSLAKVWTVAITLICYCYYIASRIPKGSPRLIALFPVLFMFTILPLNLHAFHFCGPTAFFLTWLGNFKLLLFAFDLDPLSPPLPNLFRFLAVLCLPIKIKKHPSPNPEKTADPSRQNLQKPENQAVEKSVVLALKVLLLGVVIRLYEYRQQLHPNCVFVLYCLHLYFGLEIVLALCSIPARAIFGTPLDRQFNEPHLSTSLQDFWGRRWNLMVPNILRPTVYNPTRSRTSCIFGPRWAHLLAMIAAFTVSGLMHELLYYYFTRVSPTWEVTSFFVLHGICTAAEVAAKAALGGRVRLHRAVSGPLTLGFLMVTARWLMFPQLIRHGVDERAIGEYGALVNFVKTKTPLLY